MSRHASSTPYLRYRRYAISRQPVTTRPLTTMITPFRARTPRLISYWQPRILLQRSYATRDRTSDRLATNDPNPPEAVQNVSDSNAVPISPQGLRDEERPLQEMPEDSERQRVMQAPNRKDPWSRSQQPRERAMSGPRFEQTIMEYQVYTLLLERIWESWRLTPRCTNPASTRSRNRSYSQTAGEMGQYKGGLVRWRWRTIGPSKDIHQHRQASDQLVHILWPSFCELYPSWRS